MDNADWHHCSHSHVTVHHVREWPVAGAIFEETIYQCLSCGHKVYKRELPRDVNISGVIPPAIAGRTEPGQQKASQSAPMLMAEVERLQSENAALRKLVREIGNEGVNMTRLRLNDLAAHARALLDEPQPEKGARDDGDR